MRDQDPADGVGAEEERQRGGPEEQHADRRREPGRTGILELGGRAEPGLDDGGVEAQHRAVLRAEGGAEEQHDGEQRGDPLLLEHEAEHQGGGEHRLVGAGPTRVDGCGGGGRGHGAQPKPDSVDRQLRLTSFGAVAVEEGPSRRGAERAGSVPVEAGDDLGVVGVGEQVDQHRLDVAVADRRRAGPRRDRRTRGRSSPARCAGAAADDASTCTAARPSPERDGSATTRSDFGRPQVLDGGGHDLGVEVGQVVRGRRRPTERLRSATTARQPGTPRAGAPENSPTPP